jgi:EAL domain-containing protein (putative c-di-GMP-specific phosphodiesterase class I)
MRLASKLGIDDEIGHWVIRQACEFCRQKRAEGLSRLTVSIRATARSLSGGKIVEAIKKALESTGLPSSALVIRFSERMIAVNYDKFMAALSELKKIGISVVIDNVGSHYSVMSLLRHSAISALTLDITLFSSQIDEFDRHYVTDLIEHAKANNVSVGVTGLGEGLQAVTSEQQLRLATGAVWYDG